MGLIDKLFGKKKVQDRMPSQRLDMVPPWEQFPTYTRYTIGWRMGVGEDYRYDWYAFIDGLPKDFDSRLDYLKRHRPAPLNWGKEILAFLYPDAEPEQKFRCTPAETQKLLDLGLVEHDAAYHTWIGRQSTIVWPWSWPVGKTPQKAARYRTREFWFFSRQLAAARGAGNAEVDKVPRAWKCVERQLLTGHLGHVDVTQGLVTLAQMFCAGSVRPPWKYGLSPSDFSDSFEMDIGYSDAFLLWIKSAFDDDKLLWEMLPKTQVPDKWMKWLEDGYAFFFFG